MSRKSPGKADASQQLALHAAGLIGLQAALYTLACSTEQAETQADHEETDHHHVRHISRGIRIFIDIKHLRIPRQCKTSLFVSVVQGILAHLQLAKDMNSVSVLTFTGYGTSSTEITHQQEDIGICQLEMTEY